MQTQALFGLWWCYNVNTDAGPIKEHGRVFFVTDDFGNLMLVDRRSTNMSLS